MEKKTGTIIITGYIQGFYRDYVKNGDYHSMTRYTWGCIGIM